MKQVTLSSGVVVKFIGNGMVSLTALDGGGCVVEMASLTKDTLLEIALILSNNAANCKDKQTCT